MAVLLRTSVLGRGIPWPSSQTWKPGDISLPLWPAEEQSQTKWDLTPEPWDGGLESQRGERQAEGCEEERESLRRPEG